MPDNQELPEMSVETKLLVEARKKAVEKWTQERGIANTYDKSCYLDGFVDAWNTRVPDTELIEAAEKAMKLTRSNQFQELKAAIAKSKGER